MTTVEAATLASCWCAPEPGDVHPWSPAEIQLCDPDGVVRRGAMHHGVNYECTGHAHWSGLHIRCTSAAHRADGTAPGFAVISAPVRTAADLTAGVA